MPVQITSVYNLRDLFGGQYAISINSNKKKRHRHCVIIVRDFPGSEQTKEALSYILGFDNYVPAGEGGV